MEVKIGPGEDTKLRLIIVGKSGDGRSTTGNTILSQPVFYPILQPKTITLEFESRQGSWQGRKVSVASTDESFYSKQYNVSAQFETGACAEVSRPSRYPLTYVTQVGHFTSNDVTAANRVWDDCGDESARHTDVLFTCKEESRGESLQEYVQKSNNYYLREQIWQCGDRYGGFSYKATGAEQQAQMVQTTVLENGGRHYVKRLYEVPMTHPDMYRPAYLENIQGAAYSSPPTLLTNPLPPTTTTLVYQERRIVLVGKTGNGKSATGNTILGDKCFVSAMSPKSVTATCQKMKNNWNGRKIIVVDTPGFFDTTVAEKETAAEVKKCVNMCYPGPHVILQVVRPGRFSKEEKEVAKLISKIFSLNAKNYMILLFTHKDDLEETSLEDFLSQGDDSLRKQIEQYGYRYLAFNNKAKGEEREKQMAELMTMIDQLVHSNRDAPFYTEAMMKEDEKHYKKSKLSYCSIL